MEFWQPQLSISDWLNIFRILHPAFEKELTYSKDFLDLDAT